MKYLQQTMHETLRLYPVVPFNMRLALCDTTLPHGGGPDCMGPVGVLKDTFVGYSALTLQWRQDLLPAASAEFSNVTSFFPGTLSALDAEALDVYTVQWGSENLYWTAVCVNRDGIYDCDGSTAFWKSGRQDAEGSGEVEKWPMYES